MTGEKNQAVLPILRSVYQDLTKSEQRIASYIMENAARIMEQTIPELAGNTKSSEITISRFCKKLGFSGLQALKIALAAELSNAGEMEFREIGDKDTEEQVAAKVFQNIMDGLQDTLKILDFQQVAKAVQVVVIAVSHTGATIKLLEAVRVAKRAGAAVIVITSYAQSNLAKLGDVVLTGMGREVHYSSESVASRLIHMAITDVLYTAMARSNPESYHDNIAKMRSVIADTRE